jgi:hypothetical protein
MKRSPVGLFLVLFVVFLPVSIWLSPVNSQSPQEPNSAPNLSRGDQELMTEAWRYPVILRVRQADGFKYSDKKSYIKAQRKYSELLGLHEAWLETVSAGILKGDNPARSKSLNKLTKQIASECSAFVNLVDGVIDKTEAGIPKFTDINIKVSAADFLKGISDSLLSWWTQTKTRKVEERKAFAGDMRQRLHWKSWDELTSDLQNKPNP